MYTCHHNRWTTLRRGLARSNGVSSFSFLGDLHTYFYSGCTSVHCSWQWRSVYFPRIIAGITFWVLDDSLSTWDKMESWYCFDLYFSGKQNIVFMYYCPFVLWEGPIHFILIGFLGEMGHLIFELCILHINQLYVGNTFYHSVGCLSLFWLLWKSFKK